MTLLVLCLGYLLGSIPFGVLASKVLGKDVRRYGSGNIGATNVLRVLGIPAAVVVLAGDIGKGLLAMFLAKRILVNQWTVMLAGLAAIAGHNWSIFLGFKGGKGVATSLGVALMLSPALTAAVILVFVFVVATTRYVSLGSVLAAALAPFISYALDLPAGIIVFSVVAGAFIVIRHWKNIQRIRAGTEHRLGEKAASRKPAN